MLSILELYIPSVIEMLVYFTQLLGINSNSLVFIPRVAKQITDLAHVGIESLV